jgi:hypothetical protein
VNYSAAWLLWQIPESTGSTQVLLNGALLMGLVRGKRVFRR